MTANDFEKLLADLIDGYQNNSDVIDPNNEEDKVFNIENFNGAALGEYMAEQNNFWKFMLENVDSQLNGANNGEHYGIRWGDFPKDFESVMKFIANRAELDNIDFLEYCKKVKDTNNNHWNESMNKLMTDLYNYQTDGGGNFLVYKGENEADSIGWRRSVVRNQDAGYDFDNKYVWLEQNLDKETYQQVRNKDKMIKVLQDSSQLQFTCEQKPNTKVRLIMPKYLRRVEIEDLNRNFWVIGQSITALCAFLFGPNKPLVDLLKGILKELPELWENILYLWAQIAVMLQKPKITHIENIFFPIYNSELEAYIKYDNFQDSKVSFDNGKELEAVWERIKSIKDRYTNSHLVIVPEIRDKNYYHNYYSKVHYPGVIVFDRNSNKVSYYTMQLEIDLTNKNDSFLKNIVGIARRDNKYYLLSDFTTTDENKIPDEEEYFGGVRVIPTIESEYNETENKIKLKTLKFDCYDIAHDLFSFDTNNQDKKITTITTTINDSTITLQNNVQYTKISTDKYNIIGEEIKKGLYLGEVVSVFYDMPEIDYNTEFQFVSFTPTASGELQLRMSYETYVQNQPYNGGETKAQDYVMKQWIAYLDKTYGENNIKPPINFKKRSAKFLVTRIMFVSKENENSSSIVGTNYQCCIYLTILLRTSKGKILRKICRIQSYDYEEGWPQFPMVSASVEDPVGRLSTKKLMAIKDSSRKVSDYQNDSNGEDKKLTLIHESDSSVHYLSMAELKEKGQLKPLRRTCEKEEDEKGNYKKSTDENKCECGGASLGTFICSSPKIIDPQNPKLDIFYLIVVDSAMQFCFEKDEEGKMLINPDYPTEIINPYAIAYYYKCEVDEEKSVVKAYYKGVEKPDMDDKCDYIVKASDILEGVTDTTEEDTDNEQSSDSEQDKVDSEKSNNIQAENDDSPETGENNTELKLRSPFNKLGQKKIEIGNGHTQKDLLVAFNIGWGFCRGAIRMLEGGEFVDDGGKGPLDEPKPGEPTGEQPKQ